MQIISYVTEGYGGFSILFYMKKIKRNYIKKVYRTIRNPPS